MQRRILLQGGRFDGVTLIFPEKYEGVPRCIILNSEDYVLEEKVEFLHTAVYEEQKCTTQP